jgi:hypothetical protein
MASSPPSSIHQQIEPRRHLSRSQVCLTSWRHGGACAAGSPALRACSLPQDIPPRPPRAPSSSCSDLAPFDDDFDDHLDGDSSDESGESPAQGAGATCACPSELTPERTPCPSASSCSTTPDSLARIEPDEWLPPSGRLAVDAHSKLDEEEYGEEEDELGSGALFSMESLHLHADENTRPHNLRGACAQYVRHTADRSRCRLRF